MIIFDWLKHFLVLNPKVRVSLDLAQIIIFRSAWKFDYLVASLCSVADLFKPSWS